MHIKESQKNIFFLIAFILLVASSFLIEGFKDNFFQNSDQVKTIQFWHYWSGIEKKPINDLVAKFNSENHGFEVKALSISMPRKKIMTAIVGNVAPDLMHVDGDMVTDFALRNALAEIDLTNFETNKFNPNFLKMVNIKDAQWAIPYIGGTEAMYINKDLLDKWGLSAPESLEDLVEIFDKSIEKDQSSIAFIPSWPSWFGGYLPGYFGGSWINRAGAPSANSKENIEAWEWIEKNFVDKMPADKILSFSEGFGAYQSPDNPFYSGKVAIEASGVWERKLAKIYAPEMNIEVKAFPGTVQNATYLSVNALAIPRNARHKEEALVFLKWLLEPENVEFLALDQKQFTPYKSHSKRFFMEHENEYIETFIELAKSPNAKFMPQVSYLTRYKKEIQSAYDKVIRKQKTAKQALNELQETILKISNL